MMDAAIKNLVLTARKYVERAYSPYSGFSVGASVLTENGKIYGGCNVENVSFSATCCAERTAILKAVSEGERKISSVVISSNGKPPYPCGVCRQVMCEFGGPDLKVYIDCGNDHPRCFNLDKLLPYSFKEF